MTLESENDLLFDLFNKGQYQKSYVLARRMCTNNPSLSTAWKIIGAVRFLLNDNLNAKSAFIYSSIINTNDAEIQYNLGVAYESSSNENEAIEAYLQAIRIRPGYPEAYNNLGNVLRRLGRCNDSIAAFREALKQRPSYLKAQQNLARSLLDDGRNDAARVAYQSAICIEPDYPDAYNNLGVVLIDSELARCATKQFDRAIRIKKSFTEAHSNLGIALYDLGSINEARLSYQHALCLKPSYSQALNNIGNCLRHLTHLHPAYISFKRALITEPNYEEAHNNLGIIEFEQNDHLKSTESYYKAISLRPNYSEAYNNLGITSYTIGDSDAAYESLKRALSINPNYAEALSNIGAVLRSQGHFTKAHIAYENAISLKSNYAEAHWNNGLLHLLEGNYQLGWQGYEWRLHNNQLKSRIDINRNKVWLGDEPIADKRIFVYSEQGNGDTLQFYRYIKLLSVKGAKVLFEVQPELYEFMRSQTKSIEIYKYGDRIPDYDWATSLMSLPLAFGTTIETIPSPYPYLTVDPLVKPRWEAILGVKKRIRVGLVPSGNPNHSEDSIRSLKWENMLPLFELPIDFFCLKKHLNDIDLRFLNQHPEIKNLSKAMIDYNDTAALASMMDIVISVDTSVAHLSAGLGTDTWIILPWVPDWRWLLERTDSPWYQSVLLFRQGPDRSWDGVISRIVRYLEDKIKRTQI